LEMKMQKNSLAVRCASRIVVDGDCAVLRDGHNATEVVGQFRINGGCPATRQCLVQSIRDSIWRVAKGYTVFGVVACIGEVYINICLCT
jgi:hypothetical protein